MRLRTRKLIDTGMQLRLTLWFVGVTGMAMLLQFVVLSSTLQGMESELGEFQHPGAAMNALLRSFLATLAIGLSLTLVTGVLVTHRVCGPIYRFTQFLEAVMRGEHPGECRIRKNDELHDFCAVLNQVTEPLRASKGETGADEGTDEAPAPLERAA
jgi:nitrogen fixation/metabolism regulation signal transduction histidine kinase